VEAQGKVLVLAAKGKVLVLAAKGKVLAAKEKILGQMKN
jgi:hypothetical protein